MSEYVSPLRRRMIEDMTVRNLSATTQTSYIHNIKKFSQYFGRSPDCLGLEDVRAYQVYLVSLGVAWATLNQVVSSLRFFFGVTLGRKDLPERIAYARRPKTLPVVLSPEEVATFLGAVPNRKDRVALTTAYATGLRASEVVGLRIQDIDSSRMVIRWRSGVGGN
jgi:site-specific recombinase XerD